MFRTESTVPLPRVRFATYINEDTGRVTELYWHSHEEIDAEIDARIRADEDRRGHHEATRAKWHAKLDASACRNASQGQSYQAA